MNPLEICKCIGINHQSLVDLNCYFEEIQNFEQNLKLYSKKIIFIYDAEP